MAAPDASTEAMHVRRGEFTKPAPSTVTVVAPPTTRIAVASMRRGTARRNVARGAYMKLPEDLWEIQTAPQSG